MYAFVLRICFVYALLGVTFAELPSYIKVCKRKDPDINKCISNSIENLREILAKGIPELDAPPIEPLILQHVRLLRGPSGARLDLNLTNLAVSGPSTFQVRDLKADPENVVFTFKVSFAKLQFRGKYQINARLLLFHIVGDGDISGTFSDYDSDVILRANKVLRNGKIYLDFEKMKIAIKIGSANFKLTNLFGGDPTFERVSNEILNSNQLFLEEIKPVLETALSDLFTDVSNKITSSFTYEELFPDD